jgi:hypothetical protein
MNLNLNIWILKVLKELLIIMRKFKQIGSDKMGNIEDKEEKLWEWRENKRDKDLIDEEYEESRGDFEDWQ